MRPHAFLQRSVRGPYIVRTYGHCKSDQPFIIHRAHHIWFDENNSRLSIEDKHTLGSLLLRLDTDGHIHDSDFLNVIPCKIDPTSTS